MPVHWGDLEFAFSAANAGPLSAAWIHRKRGDVKTADDVVENHEDPPAHGGDWIDLPSAETLGLKQPLACAFAQQHCPALADTVRACFTKSDGWRAFISILVQHGYLLQWHEFERHARRAALQAWAATHALTVIDGDLRSPSALQSGSPSSERPA